MTSPTPLLIEARLDEAERPAMHAAHVGLGRLLTDAAEGVTWPVQVVVRKPGSVKPLEPAPAATILSLLPDARSDQPIAEVEARWREDLLRLRSSETPAFICTVFRHVEQRENAGSPSPLLERIRRLNALAPHLSHDFDAGVIDFDRALAHVGARALATDYRLQGPHAARIAGHTIMWRLLSYGLDAAIPSAVQEKAKMLLGGPEQAAARALHAAGVRK